MIYNEAASSFLWLKVEKVSSSESDLSSSYFQLDLSDIIDLISSCVSLCPPLYISKLPFIKINYKRGLKNGTI